MNDRLEGGTHGTQEHVLKAGAFIVSRTEHRPNFSVGAHMHERASVNIVLGGVYRETFRRETGSFGPETFLAKPAGEVHANDFGPNGASCLLIETEDERMIGFFPGLLRQPAVRSARPSIAHSAAICAELSSFDVLAPLSVESRVVQLLVVQSRDARRIYRSEAGWMKRALELLHADPPCQLSLARLAAAVGVHPVHLARTFKHSQGVSVGAYARSLRTERAIALLGTTQASISEVAAEAGFYDQSHMARHVKRATGRTPAQLRAARRR